MLGRREARAEETELLSRGHGAPIRYLDTMNERPPDSRSPSSRRPVSSAEYRDDEVGVWMDVRRTSSERIVRRVKRALARLRTGIEPFGKASTPGQESKRS